MKKIKIREKIKKWNWKRKAILLLVISSVSAYISAFFLFVTAPFLWKMEDAYSIMKLAGSFFFIGMLCSEISAVCTVPEGELWYIMGEKDELTKEDLEEIKRLLSELDELDHMDDIR